MPGNSIDFVLSGAMLFSAIYIYPEYFLRLLGSVRGLFSVFCDVAKVVTIPLISRTASWMPNALVPTQAAHVNGSSGIQDSIGAISVCG
jgi:hypothetical protein